MGGRGGGTTPSPYRKVNDISEPEKQTMTHPNPAQHDLQAWDDLQAYMAQQLRDPLKAEQHYQQFLEDVRLLDRFRELGDKLEALLFLIAITIPEQRKRHFGQGKAVKAGDFKAGEN